MTENFGIHFEEKNIFENRHIKEFIKKRNFNEEDFNLIEVLSSVPVDILIEHYHNFFFAAQERSAEELDRLIARWEQKCQEDADIQQKLLSAKIDKDIVEKYDWLTANHLNSILENL